MGQQQHNKPRKAKPSQAESSRIKPRWGKSRVAQLHQKKGHNKQQKVSRKRNRKTGSINTIKKLECSFKKIDIRS